MKGTRETGKEYENMAEAYLKEKGYVILNRNFYSKFGEIDIIAKKEEYLVFIEVKYRKNQDGGHPLEAVTPEKQNKIKKTAEFYFLRYGLSENTACRFDVVGILGNDIIHIENAF